MSEVHILKASALNDEVQHIEWDLSYKQDAVGAFTWASLY